MTMTYTQWYNEFDKMVQEKTGARLNSPEAAYYVMYYDAQEKKMKSLAENPAWKKDMAPKDLASVLLNQHAAGAKLFVMDGQSPTPTPVSINAEMEPSFAERHQKPSRFQRFLNTITFGQAYKKEIAAYHEQEAAERAAAAHQVDVVAPGIANWQKIERAEVQGKARESVQNTLKSRERSMLNTEMLMEDLLGPNSIYPDHLRNIPSNTEAGKRTAERISQTLQHIADHQYDNAPDFDAKQGAIIGLGAAMLDSSIDGVDISGSSPAGLDFDPQVNIRKNQRIMLIENTLALNGRDAIRNAGVFDMIANGRDYTADAMQEYQKGNVAPIADALRQVIETCTENWNTAIDLNSNRTRVNGMLIADTMEMIEQNPALKAAIGLSQKQMNRAKAISGVMQIYNEGQEAMRQLAENPSLTAAQREEAAKKAVASAIFCSNWQQESKAVTNALMEEINAVIPEEQITERMTSQSIAIANRSALTVENSIIHMGVEQTQKRFESVALNHPLYKDLTTPEKAMTTLRDMNELRHPKLQRTEQDLATMTRNQHVPIISYQRVSTMDKSNEMEADMKKGIK